MKQPYRPRYLARRDTRLYAAYGLKRPAALNGAQFLTADVLKTPLKIENGIAQIPAGPGSGIEVDEEKTTELQQLPR